MSGSDRPKGRDISKGLPLADLADRVMVLGQLGDDAVLLVKQGSEVFAIGATCTHYNGPLAEGLLVGDTVRCPWHHACFDLRSGEAAAPALNAVSCWRVERVDGDRVRVVDKLAARRRRAETVTPASIVIVGAGAAGNAAAE